MIIIFWDYDGTLVNSEILYKKSIESYLKEKNYLLKNISDEYFFKNISGSHPEDFLKKLENDEYIKKNASIEPVEIKNYYTYYFSKLNLGEIKITDGIDSTIEKLSKDKNIVMAITSSSYTKDFSIKHKNVNNPILNSVFKIDKNVYLCGSIENCGFKPEPDIFLYALDDIVKKNNLTISSNDKVFIVEDSISGCKAAKAFKEKVSNKIRVEIIGYLGGTIIDNTKKLLDSGADIVLKNAVELYDEIIG